MKVDQTVEPFNIKDCALLVISTGKSAQNLRELRDNLIIIDPGSIYYHFWGTLLRPRFDDPEYNNDFASWIRHNLHDAILAERLGVVDPSEFNEIDDLRHELIDLIEVICGIISPGMLSSTNAVFRVSMKSCGLTCSPRACAILAKDHDIAWIVSAVSLPSCSPCCLTNVVLSALKASVSALSESSSIVPSCLRWESKISSGVGTFGDTEAFPVCLDIVAAPNTIPAGIALRGSQNNASAGRVIDLLG